MVKKRGMKNYTRKGALAKRCQGNCSAKRRLGKRLLEKRVERVVKKTGDEKLLYWERSVGGKVLRELRYDKVKKRDVLKRELRKGCLKIRDEKTISYWEKEPREKGVKEIALRKEGKEEKD